MALLQNKMSCGSLCPSRFGAFFNYMTEEQTAKQSGTLVERLFEVGAHFGFSKSRRHPTVVPYIYGTKEGTDILDIEKTADLLEDAKVFLKTLTGEGKQVLFVGTKEEIMRQVHETAVSLEMPHIVNRWIGGTLTNYSEIKKRIERLKMLREQQTSGELERKYTKKERLMLSREVDKLDFNFGGIATMERLPGALLVVDPRHDDIAVKEANDLNIPVVAIMSSDCDISKVTKPVVVNDSHTKSVALALSELAMAVREGAESAVTKTAAKTKEA